MDRIVRQKSGFIHHKNKIGFTFIEVIIAIALIGVMAIIVTPYLRSDNFEQKRAEFVAQLNAFMVAAQYNALVTGQVQRVVFDLRASRFYLEARTSEKDGQGDYKYALVQIAYNDNAFIWDSARFKLKELYINNKDVLADSSDKVWFYIMPDGTAQSVTIHFNDIAESEKFDDVIDYRLVLNPFAVQFKIYELFQKTA